MEALYLYLNDPNSTCYPNVSCEFHVNYSCLPINIVYCKHGCGKKLSMNGRLGFKSVVKGSCEICLSGYKLELQKKINAIMQHQMLEVRRNNLLNLLGPFQRNLHLSTIESVVLIP